MKKMIAVALMLVGVVALADRSDVWLASSVRLQEVSLFPLADGGCAVQVTADYRKTDGGYSTERQTRQIQVAGANRTACLDVLNRADSAFKNEKGL